jgi:hypothetical protein
LQSIIKLNFKNKRRITEMIKRICLCGASWIADETDPTNEFCPDPECGARYTREEPVKDGEQIPPWETGLNPDYFLCQQKH